MIWKKPIPTPSSQNSEGKRKQLGSFYCTANACCAQNAGSSAPISLGGVVVPPPPTQGPDVALSDFQLLSHIKEHMEGQSLALKQQVKRANAFA